MGFFSKIKKKIKKVFKKVVKVVKKVVKSKIFKAIVIAALVIYTAGAVSGAIAASQAAAATTASMTAAGLAPITVAPMALAGGAGISAGVTGAAAGMGASTGIMGSIAAGAKAAGSWATANPMLSSSVLTTGGKMLSGYAAGKAEEEAAEKERERLDKNGSYKLRMRQRDTGSEGTNSAGDGGVDNDSGNVSTDGQGRTQYSNTPVQNLSNVEQMEGQKYYDTSTNSYKEQGK